jgi:hypothetical protein
MTAIQQTRTARRDRDETSVVVWLHGCLMDAQMAISTTRAVDEGIGSMRDSAGPKMRKTFARPACETALPTFPGQQTACPPQALPPCAARVLPSQYTSIPSDGKTERRAQGSVQCGRGPCVHVWCRAPYVTGRLCRSRAPWVPGPRPAPNLLTRATAKTGERRRSRHAALVLPA